MISTTFIYLGAILGTNLFTAYLSGNSGKYRKNDKYYLDREIADSDDVNECNYSLNKVPVTLVETNLYNSFIKQLCELKKKGTIDDKLTGLKNISARIGLHYLQTSIPLPSSGKPISFRLITVLENRFKRFANDNNISNLFDKVKSYIEFCLREFSDTQGDEIYYYLIDFAEEKKLSCKNEYPEIVKQYRDELEELFLPIILSKENKKQNQEIQTKYRDRQFSDNKIHTYIQLLHYTGNLYNKTCEFYKKYGIYIGTDIYNHEIIYETAKTILGISDFYFTHGMSASNLAHDITNHNINFLHHHQPEAKKGEDVQTFLSSVIKNYFSGRKIKNYYYFLIMSSRAYHSLEKNWKTDDKRLYSDIYDENEFRRNAIDCVYNAVRDLDFPFLDGLSGEEIKEHILKTDPEPYEKKENLQ